jgi:hypothetical protein
MHLEFARFIEHGIEDEEVAKRIRESVMSEWVSLLIREFAVEMYRAMGYEVTWEYVGDEGEEKRGEGEEEDLMGDAGEDEDEIEEMVSGNEYESDDEGNEDEEDWQ